MAAITCSVPLRERDEGAWRTTGRALSDGGAGARPQHQRHAVLVAAIDEHGDLAPAHLDVVRPLDRRLGHPVEGRESSAQRDRDDEGKPRQISR